METELSSQSERRWRVPLVLVEGEGNQEQCLLSQEASVCIKKWNKLYFMILPSYRHLASSESKDLYCTSCVPAIGAPRTQKEQLPVLNVRGPRLLKRVPGFGSRPDTGWLGDPGPWASPLQNGASDRLLGAGYEDWRVTRCEVLQAH